MSTPGVTARIEVREDGSVVVRAPGVGIWSDHPAAGSLLSSGSPLGSWSVLGRARRLELPDGVAGRVTGDLPADRVVAVEFGQVLFTLAPLEIEAAEVAPALAGKAADLPAGAHAILAPTDGVFYGRPAPDEPPFVETGDTVTTGQPVGLVEVMKTFNLIHYGGAGLPEAAEVIEVRVADGEEVRAAQPLLIVR